MKNLILVLALAFSASAQAEDVLMTSRYGYGTYETTATYSFRKMSHDVKLTRNNWDILFEAREDFADYFEVNTVTDDRSNIYDMGNICDPSLVDLGKIGPSSRAEVVLGHCYLIDGRDSDGRVLATFRVTEHVKSVATRISEIKVLGKSEYRR